MYFLLCSYLIHVQRLLEKLKKNFASEDEEDGASEYGEDSASEDEEDSASEDENHNRYIIRHSPSWRPLGNY